MGRKKVGAIAVEGLDELRRELKKLDDAGLTKELKDANYKVASLVVDASKARANSRLERKAALSLSAGRQAARAQVAGGGPRAPFFGGAEFGARKYPQFQPWRGNGITAGYFLFPAIRAETDRIVDLYGDEIQRITSAAFPD